jgi:hypothetical protein
MRLSIAIYIDAVSTRWARKCHLTRKSFSATTKIAHRGALTIAV